MKILIFSDIHIHSHKNSLKRLRDCLDALQWVFDTARKNDIDNVLFLGDLFQNRQKIDTLTYYETYKIFESARDLQIYLLLGNHDLWYHEQRDVNTIAPLCAMSNVAMIAQPSTLEIDGFPIDFIPFTHDPIKVVDEQFRRHSSVLCGHIAINNAQLNKVYNIRSEVSVEIEKDMVAVDSDLFSSWERVFLGHYHGEQKLDKITEYVGSPLQLNFSEAFQKKHIVVLDTDDLTTEYIVNDFSPKHLILNEEDVGKVDLNNCFVEIRVNDIHSSQVIDMRQSVSEKYNVLSLDFSEIKKREHLPDQIEIQQKFDVAKGDMLERYVEAVGVGDLDKATLIQFGKEICMSEVK